MEAIKFDAKLRDLSVVWASAFQRCLVHVSHHRIRYQYLYSCIHIDTIAFREYGATHGRIR